MKKIIFLFILAFICSTQSLLAQKVNGPMDSVHSLLCKKWEVDYVLMGGMKIERLPGATEVNFEFKQDKTFLMTSNDPTETTKGTWNYDAKKKSINLSMKGKSSIIIASLKKEELVMLTTPSNESVPDDMKDMQMVYKPKGK